MDISEAKQKKKELQYAITDLIVKFNIDTGLQVSDLSVYINNTPVVGEQITRVNVEVKI